MTLIQKIVVIVTVVILILASFAWLFSDASVGNVWEGLVVQTVVIAGIGGVIYWVVGRKKRKSSR